MVFEFEVDHLILTRIFTNQEVYQMAKIKLNTSISLNDAFENFLLSKRAEGLRPLSSPPPISSSILPVTDPGSVSLLRSKASFFNL